MADLAVAAAAAAGRDAPPPSRGGRGGGRGRGRPGYGRGAAWRGAAHPPRGSLVVHDPDELALSDGDIADGELPNVDDLEVAAAAAEAAAEALERVQAAPPLAPRLVARMLETDQAGDEAGGASSSSDGSDDEQDDSGGGGPGAHTGAGVSCGGRSKALRVVDVKLNIQGDSVRVCLAPLNPARNADLDMASSSDNDSEAFEPSKLREIIDRVDRDDGSDGEPAALGAEALGLPPTVTLDVEVAPGDSLTPAGVLSSIVEGLAVVQAPPNARALGEGSVLCLEDRTILGRVDDVFGPVLEPLYALRLPGDGTTPARAQVGAPVFSVDKFAQFLLADDLRTKGYDPGEDVEVEGDGDTSSEEEDLDAVLKDVTRGRRVAPQAHGGRGTGATRGRNVREGRGRGGRGPSGRAPAGVPPINMPPPPVVLPPPFGAPMPGYFGWPMAAPPYGVPPQGGHHHPNLPYGHPPPMLVYSPAAGGYTPVMPPNFAPFPTAPGAVAPPGGAPHAFPAQEPVHDAAAAFYRGEAPPPQPPGAAGG